MKTAYLNGTIVTIDDHNTVIHHGVLVVEDGKIIHVGSVEDFDQQSAEHTVDLKGKWVLPGLVNTHSHILMTILRGIGDDMQLKPWLETRIWPMEQQYTTETAKWSTALGLVEMLKSGTTTFSDMFNPIGIDADEVARVIGEAGIRSIFSQTLFSFGTEEEQKENVRKAREFAKTWRNEFDGRMTTMAAPHSPYTCSPDMLQEAAKLAADYQIPVHIHLSETAQEVQKNVDDYGKRPVAHLESLGIFNQPTIIAHGVHLTQEERETLAKYNVAVAHNPISNLKLGSGIADVTAMLTNGIMVGIATDSVASNNNFDMFQELRIAALLQKGAKEDSTKMPAETVLRLATKDGAQAIRLPEVGSLEVGKQADFITIDPTNQPHLQPKEHVVSHLVYAASGSDVCDVYVKGKALVQNGECTTLDEERILFEADRVYRNLKK
ncbi:amidohydrolase family protein [Bacillus taeanensis]|uniref:5-methylthioadenosine/S-adenosylhomocysteine deaminase n=1 Tax=Bacillus taeanensis TaxID=273032 RepID=A0A366Y573_9BACI|nr:amidohydrolase family protein [Bacillus taeanensis]RBW71361.1 5-methylthioadenosine deaminase [Bacillus taeanensis]